MKIVFFGTPELAVPTLERLLNDPQFTVVGVVTQPDKKRGRGNELSPSPVKMVATAHNLPVWQPIKIKKSLETINSLRAAEADFFVVVAYGQILSQEILDIPRIAPVNIHGSILPKYRGAAPIQWSIYHGEKDTGITTMLMDAGMDSGPMLLKSVTPIMLLDNATTLGERLAEIGAELLIETLIKLAKQEIKGEPQNEDQVTFAPLLKDENYLIDWEKSAIDLHNQIRAFYPNCHTKFRHQPLKILATAPLGPEYWSELPPEIASLQQNWQAIDSLLGGPGEIAYIAKKLGPIVHTGSGLILLREIQLPGKRAMSGQDFINGIHPKLGETLGF